MRFVHRQETIEEDSVRDDLGLASPLKMQLQPKCLKEEERCIAFWGCCSFYCDIMLFCAVTGACAAKNKNLSLNLNHKFLCITIT